MPRGPRNTRAEGQEEATKREGGVKIINMPSLTIKDESFAFCFAQVHMTRAKGA